jgi:hypothetical protein
MTSINSINVNTQGVGSSYGYSTKSKSEKEEVKDSKPEVTSQKPQVAADDVFSYMAQSAVSVAPTTTKTIDPAKYVDETSAARIAGFMADFEDKVAEGLASFDKEFAGADMSDSTKMALVLAGMNKEA